ncbi:hypothetical protein [Nocardia sp. CDC160]|uniref:hypothetical protein n=1 Tax=Nocardia sp. CDC160 TaxID=3112166 RepID=UPI002DBBA89C|nr:hypothetical protein [Nocardia sp. CDC160]MEC3913274.1 hypothetical protein [Nocardia sp. CDC160]
MSELETLHYTRIEMSADGGSRFVDDRMELGVRPVAVGVDPMAVGELGSGAVAFVRSGGFDAVPHPAPARQWVVMVRGTIEVTTTDGETRRFAPGELLLAADVEGLGHTSVGVGEPPFEALFIPAPENR